MAYPSPVPIGLHAEHILNADGIESVVLVEAIDRFPDNPPEMTVVTFDPEFDEVGQRWFVDVHVETGDTYFPLCAWRSCATSGPRSPEKAASHTNTSRLPRSCSPRQCRCSRHAGCTSSPTAPVTSAPRATLPRHAS